MLCRFTHASWQSGILRKIVADQVLWKLSSLLLIGLGPLALSAWSGLKVWGGTSQVTIERVNTMIACSIDHVSSHYPEQNNGIPSATLSRCLPQQLYNGNYAITFTPNLGEHLL
jgi:hypothetical protein